MLSYINNNLVLINEYQNLYLHEINIDKVIERFRTEEIIKHNGFDYGRFRVFIDSCLLLLNKEKLNDYYKNRYSFKEFIKEVENDIHLENYFALIKQEPLTNDISNICLYHSVEFQYDHALKNFSYAQQCISGVSNFVFYFFAYIAPNFHFDI